MVILLIFLFLKRISLQLWTFFEIFYFLFKAFVKVELSFVFTINLSTLAENCVLFYDFINLTQMHNITVSAQEMFTYGYRKFDKNIPSTYSGMFVYTDLRHMNIQWPFFQSSLKCML